MLSFLALNINILPCARFLLLPLNLTGKHEVHKMFAVFFDQFVDLSASAN